MRNSAKRYARKIIDGRSIAGDIITDLKKQRKKNEFVQHHQHGAGFTPHHENGAGFSLVETIVYLAIVAILLTAMVNFNLSLGNNFNNAHIDTLALSCRTICSICLIIARCRMIALWFLNSF